MRTTLFCLLLALASASANAEIHRCPQADGTVAFQETPCPDPAPEETIEAKAEPAEEAPLPETAVITPTEEPELVLPESLSRDREQCEKATRDAIDAIDLEMRQTSYTKEEGEAYLARLLELTEQLRACKQL